MSFEFELRTGNDIKQVGLDDVMVLYPTVLLYMNNDLFCKCQLCDVTQNNKVWHNDDYKYFVCG